MAKQTLQTRMVNYFSSIGYKQIPSRNKYIMLEGKHDKNKTDIVYLFIGSNGAVRYNVNSKNAANSISYTDRAKQRLEKYELLKGKTNE